METKKTASKILDKISVFSIFMIFFGLPVFFTGLSLQGVVFEKQIYFYFWLLLGSVSWISKGIIAGKINIRRTPLDIPIFGFWVAYLLATVFSVDHWHSLWGAFGDPSRGLLSITALVVAYYFIFSNFSIGRLRLILGALVGSGLIVSLWTLIAIFNVQIVPSAVASSLPISTIGSITGLGTFFSAMVILVSLLIMKVSETDGIGKVWKRAVLIVLITNLALDLFLILVIWNFVPWFSLIAGAVIFLVFILAKIVRPKGNWAVLPMALFVIILILRMVGAINISKVDIPTEVSLNYQSSWDVAKESLKGNFFLGSGPATYGYDFSLYHNQDFNSNALYNLRFFQGSGIFFEAIPTIGGIGTIFLLLVILFALSIMFHYIRREKEKNKLYSLGFFSAFAILLISILSTKEEGTICLLTALVGTVALAIALKESEVEEKYFRFSLRVPPEFALALASIFMIMAAGIIFFFVFLGKVYMADIYAGDAAKKVYLGSEEDSIPKLSKAIKINPQESGYYLQAGQYYMILANKEASKGTEGADISKIQELLNSSIDITSQGIKLNKDDASLVGALAQIYENADAFIPNSMNLAAETYQRGLELEPKNPDFYLKIGQIKINLATSSKEEDQKKQLVGEAKEMFQKSINQKSNYGPGYFNLALTQKTLEDIDGAIESGRKALETDPKNENYILALAGLYQTRGNESDNDTIEQLYKYAIALNDANQDGHFYLGLFYEKNNNKQGARDEYKKVISLIGDSSPDGNKQLEKMISNVDAGIKNTPETMGLIQEQSGIQDQGGKNQSPVKQP